MIAIQEAKDLNTLSLDALIGSLKTHEKELIEAHENVSGKEKNVAVISSKYYCSTSFKASEDYDDQGTSNDDEHGEDKFLFSPKEIHDKKGIYSKERLETCTTSTSTFIL